MKPGIYIGKTEDGTVYVKSISKSDMKRKRGILVASQSATETFFGEEAEDLGKSLRKGEEVLLTGIERIVPGIARVLGEKK